MHFVHYHRGIYIEGMIHFLLPTWSHTCRGFIHLESYMYVDSKIHFVNYHRVYILYMIGLKGMNFDHDFDYSFPLFSSLLKNRKEEMKNEVVIMVIKSHAFQTDPYIYGGYKRVDL